MVPTAVLRTNTVPPTNEAGNRNCSLDWRGCISTYLSIIKEGHNDGGFKTINDKTVEELVDESRPKTL